MAERITDKTMDEIEILAKLSLTDEEKEKSRNEMQKMLDYVELLNSLDTDNVEPLTHLFPIENVFREDVEEESTPREEILKNAPEEKDGILCLYIGMEDYSEYGGTKAKYESNDEGKTWEYRGIVIRK